MPLLSPPPVSRHVPVLQATPKESRRPIVHRGPGNGLSMNTLRGKTLFITGASRGIGLAIALRAARDGANVAVAAKTDTPNPKLPGTVHSAAEEIEKAGGNALALVVDVRDEAAVKDAVDRTAAHFGALDIVVNNASAISLTP